MTLDGEVTEFAIPSRNSQPRAMARHPDGNIWFVETGANALGRLAPDGSIVEFPVPTSNASLRGVTVGASGPDTVTSSYLLAVHREARTLQAATGNAPATAQDTGPGQ